MSQPFFICGTPRSRTAWFAVATSTARSVCYHEPTPHLASFGELVALWRSDAGMSIGVSDSALWLQARRILSVVKPRTLIVRRSADEVVESFRQYAGLVAKDFDLERGRRYLAECEAELDALTGHPLVKSVSCADLESAIGECLAWLLPDSDLPDIKFLARMNIQVRRDHVLKLTGHTHNGWHLIP